MDRGYSCFFIGHREAGESLRPALTQAVERHITEYGVTDFFVGHYGGFDGLAAGVVKTAKKRHPEVTLTLLLPYHPYTRPTPTPPGFDGTFYPPGMENVPRRFAIVRANRWMIDNSTHLIAGVWHTASNSWEQLKYAKLREKKGGITVTQITPENFAMQE